MRPPDCPDHDCDDFADCEECLRLCEEGRERRKNIDWGAMAQTLKAQLLAIDSSPEMKEHIALIFEVGDAYDDYRLGIVHEPRPEPASEDDECEH